MRVQKLVPRLAVATLGTAAFAAAAGSAPPPDGLAVARAFREAHAPRIVREFAELLAIPNVASDTVNIRRNAELLRDELAAAGAAAELLELEGAPPVVFGRIDVPGATRTLALYVHNGWDGYAYDHADWADAKVTCG